MMMWEYKSPLSQTFAMFIDVAMAASTLIVDSPHRLHYSKRLACEILRNKQIVYKAFNPWLMWYMCGRDYTKTARRLFAVYQYPAADGVDKC